MEVGDVARDSPEASEHTPLWPRLAVAGSEFGEVELRAPRDPAEYLPRQKWKSRWRPIGRSPRSGGMRDWLPLLNLTS